MTEFRLGEAQRHEVRTAARRAAGLPLTEDQLNRDPRFSVTMELRPGDMQFLNNRTTLHSRTAYEDYPEPERRRDLIRLWLDI